MESHISDLVCLASFTECVSSGLIQAVVRWCVTPFRADAVGRCAPCSPVGGRGCLHLSAAVSGAAVSSRVQVLLGMYPGAELPGYAEPHQIA